MNRTIVFPSSLFLFKQYFIHLFHFHYLALKHHVEYGNYFTSRFSEVRKLKKESEWIIKQLKKILKYRKIVEAMNITTPWQE